jgi:hypothetical protein
MRLPIAKAKNKVNTSLEGEGPTFLLHPAALLISVTWCECVKRLHKKTGKKTFRQLNSFISVFPTEKRWIE